MSTTPDVPDPKTHQRTNHAFRPRRGPDATDRAGDLLPGIDERGTAA